MREAVTSVRRLRTRRFILALVGDRPARRCYFSREDHVHTAARAREGARLDPEPTRGAPRDGARAAQRDRAARGRDRPRSAGDRGRSRARLEAAPAGATRGEPRARELADRTGHDSRHGRGARVGAHGRGPGAARVARGTDRRHRRLGDAAEHARPARPRRRRHAALAVAGVGSDLVGVRRPVVAVRTTAGSSIPASTSAR